MTWLITAISLILNICFWHQAVMQDSFYPHQVQAIKSFKSRKLVGETQERRVGNPEGQTLRLTLEGKKTLLRGTKFY